MSTAMTSDCLQWPKVLLTAANLHRIFSIHRNEMSGCNLFYNYLEYSRLSRSTYIEIHITYYILQCDSRTLYRLYVTEHVNSVHNDMCYSCEYKPCEYTTPRKYCSMLLDLIREKCN